MASETAFFEQLARDLDYWVEAGVAACTNPDADLTWSEDPESFRALAAKLSSPALRPHVERALRNLLYGQLHSVLVMFDGGSSLANETNLTIADDNGDQYPEGLHELFVQHLFETGRMK